MGLVWTESFEGGSGWPTKYNANGSNAPGVTTGGSARTGSAAGTSSINYAVNLVGADQDDVITVGCAFHASGASPDGQMFYFAADSGATVHVSVYIQNGSTGMSTLKAYRGTSAGVLLGTSSEFVRPASGAWFYVEVKVKLHDSTGTVDLQFAGVSVLSLTGQDTKNGGTATVFDNVLARTATLTNVDAMDDFYLTNEQGSVNTSFLGVIKVECIRPTGNGNSSQGVGSDSNSTDNYLLVDETSGGSDYVDFAATGDKDTYVFGDISTGSPYLGGSTVVKGVAVTMVGSKTDAASRTLTTVARLSATETDVTGGVPQNGVQRTLMGVHETKPGGGAWTLTDVNSAEFGVKAGA